MERIEPIFYENFPDDMHCLQAALKMTLDTLGIPVSWDDADLAAGFMPGLYSWSICAAASILAKIPETRFYSALDYRQFAERGEQYLSEYWRPGWFALQKKMATQGFKREQDAAREFISAGSAKTLGLQDLESLLREDILVCQINPSKIDTQISESGHYVLLYAQQGTQFRYHDPGLPPIRAASVEKTLFMQAFEGSEAIVVPDLRIRLRTLS